MISIFIFVSGECRVRSIDMLPANAYRLLGHIAMELDRLRLNGPVDVIAKANGRTWGLLHVNGTSLSQC